MPQQCNYVIKDNFTGLYCTSYATQLEHCLWGNITNAVCFETQAQAEASIAAWDLGEQQRFIGQQPPPR